MIGTDRERESMNFMLSVQLDNNDDSNENKLV